MQNQSPASFQTVRVLWMALTLSTLFIAGVYFLQRSSGAIHVKVPPPQVMYYAIASVAAVVATLSLLFPRMVYRKAAARLREELRDRPEAEKLAALLPAFQTTFILGMALSEAISLFGLVLGMLGFEPNAILPFFAAGTLFAAMRFPTEQTVLAVLEDGGL